MIPISLHLTNFLSYVEMAEPLDFSRTSLACLSGPNGHGKSALLDAITWALWGRARGAEGGHEQERLIHDGADAMRVEFLFDLDGQTYRVIRSRSRNGKGDLTFNIRAPDGSWTDLAGEGIADTQRRITERLRMDYDTFVTSAFILQGRADTFTRLDPRDRKEVLGTILGLAVYGRLAERARERRKQSLAEAEGHSWALDTLERDLVQIDGLEQERGLAQGELEAAEAERAAAEGAVAGAQTSVGDLRALEAAAGEARKREADAAAALAREEAEALRLGREAAGLARAAETDAAAADLAAAIPELEREEARQEEARSRHEQLAAEAGSLQARIREERTRLQAERDAQERRASELEREVAGAGEARARLARAEAHLAELERTAARREQLLARRTEIRERLAALEAERAARAAEREDAQGKLRILDDAGAGCPLCAQPLTARHRQEVRRGFTAALRRLDAADRTGAKEATALSAALAAVEEEGLLLQKALGRRESLTAEVGRLHQGLERLEVAGAELAATREEAAGLAARIGAGDYAAAEREKRARLEEELAAARFDRDAYRALKERLAGARRADRALAEAREAEAALAATRQALEGARERAGRARTALEEARAGLAGMGERLAVLPAAVAELEAAVRDRDRAQGRATEAGKTVAAAGRALEALRAKEAEAAALRARLAVAGRTAALYAQLGKVFGRDGVPARIIGNAIPELRIEANRLLGLLTDGQLSVSIDPLRETKSKTVREALEVTVFDAAGGKRPYEMYSGGERLRIDFALRVALSRLLASRAGARLETLVIDEGFGSQDAEGRQRLIDAVLKVRSDFAMVLVITHLEELKDHFPTRIEVRKDPGTGSVVSVA